MSSPHHQKLSSAVLKGERRAVARALTWVENHSEGADELLRELYPQVGKGWRLGITGPPGAGKSTLVSALVQRFRAAGSERVAVLAVDPTSPFTGGALLGDRVRMTRVASDEGVFIRSMATRGAFGGLSRAASDAVDVLDSWGADPVIVESVGVGQSEVEIAGLADTTLVVLSPESGDGVQAMKAGILEVADVFVINKSDREGADQIARYIDEMLHLASSDPEDKGQWSPPVVKTVAIEGGGLDELMEVMQRHRAFLMDGAGLRNRRLRSLRRKVTELVEASLHDALWTPERRQLLETLSEDIYARRQTPMGATKILVGSFSESPQEVSGE